MLPIIPLTVIQHKRTSVALQAKSLQAKIVVNNRVSSVVEAPVLPSASIACCNGHWLATGRRLLCLQTDFLVILDALGCWHWWCCWLRRGLWCWLYRGLWC